MKANHGSGFNHHVRAGQCDRAALRQKTDQWLNSVYGVKGGEWGYSKVEAKLFVEEAVGDAETDLIEFNVRASHGKPILGSVMGKCKTPAQWAAYLDSDGVPTLGMHDPDGSPVKLLPKGLEVAEPYRRACAVCQADQHRRGLCPLRFSVERNGTVRRRNHGLSGGRSSGSIQRLGQYRDPDGLGFETITLFKVTA